MEHTFKVGDKVQFKSWEEMEKEFGVDSDGDIKTQYYFTKSMQKFCNTYAIIKEICGDGEVLLKGLQGLCYWNYIFSLDMLKPVKEEKKDFTFVVYDEMSIDEQIKWHEEKLAKLKAQKEKEKWTFTEDEKVILRNLPEEYNWITRDEDGWVGAHSDIPHKNKKEKEWGNQFGNYLALFNHIFQCIQWSDTEPCEFRKYI